MVTATELAMLPTTRVATRARLAVDGDMGLGVGEVTLDLVPGAVVDPLRSVDAILAPTGRVERAVRVTELVRGGGADDLQLVGAPDRIGLALLQDVVVTAGEAAGHP